MSGFFLSGAIDITPHVRGKMMQKKGEIFVRKTVSSFSIPLHDPVKIQSVILSVKYYPSASKGARYGYRYYDACKYETYRDRIYIVLNTLDTVGSNRCFSLQYALTVRNRYMDESMIFRPIIFFQQVF